MLRIFVTDETRTRNTESFFFLVVMQCCMFRECELMWKLVLNKENTQLQEQHATCTSWMVIGVCHM